MSEARPTSCLASLRRGDRGVIVGIDDDRARVQAIRFGIAAGSEVSCITRIPAGPIVVRSARQEIAIGRELAKRIQIREVA